MPTIIIIYNWCYVALCSLCKHSRWSWERCSESNNGIRNLTYSMICKNVEWKPALNHMDKIALTLSHVHQKSFVKKPSLNELAIWKARFYSHYEINWDAWRQKSAECQPVVFSVSSRLGDTSAEALMHQNKNDSCGGLMLSLSLFFFFFLLWASQGRCGILMKLNRESMGRLCVTCSTHHHSLLNSIRAHCSRLRREMIIISTKSVFLKIHEWITLLNPWRGKNVPCSYIVKFWINIFLLKILD